MEYIIQISFTTEWQLSCGIGDGYVADSILTRDNSGIPIITGRALRGALRESAWRLALCREDLKLAENYFFGTASSNLENEKCGCTIVGEGKLNNGLHEYFQSLDEVSREDFLQDLTILRAQTALEDNKTTKTGSLRTMQCGIAGLQFEAPLIVDSKLDEKVITSYFLAICALTKSMGAGRSRGLGNCTLTLLDKNKKNLCSQKQCELPEIFKLDKDEA